MKFYVNSGIVIALLFTVSFVRASLAGLRRRTRSTDRLEVRSSAPSLAVARAPRSTPASAGALSEAQIIARGDHARVPTEAGATFAHTGSERKQESCGRDQTTGVRLC